MLSPRLDEQTNKWYLGQHEITAPFFGYHYILAGPDAKKFVNEMGEVLPLTFEYPKTEFYANDVPSRVVPLNPRYYPTNETIALVETWVRNWISKERLGLNVEVTWSNHVHPVPYFQFLNPRNNEEADVARGQHAVGLLAFNFMVNGFTDTFRRLRFELAQIGTL